MRLIKGKMNTFWHKAAALLLLCGLILPMVPAAEAQKIEVKEGKMEIYEYRWINSYEELTSNNIFPIGNWVPVMIAWENTLSENSWGDGTLWYAKECLNSEGNKTFSPDEEVSTIRWYNDPSWDPFKYVTDPSWTMPATDEEVFLSQEKMGHFYLERRDSYSEKYYSETDSGEKKSPRFRLIMNDTTANPYYFDNGVRDLYMGQFKSAPFTYRIGQWDTSASYEFPGTNQWFKAYEWNVRMFADSDKKNSSKYCWGNVNFHYQSTGSDDHLKHKGNMMYVNDDGAEENGWDRNFRIYTEKKIEMDAYVEDITVRDGQSFRINKEMYVPDDVTITVEDGGLCIVNNRLMLNGQIKVEQGGTLIFDEAASVAPYANESNRSGSIFVDGGNVIVMEGAKVVADETQSKITVNNGGSFINRGLVVSRNISISDAGRFVNESMGLLSIGTALYDYRDKVHMTSPSVLFDNTEGQWMASLYLAEDSQIINRGKVKANDDYELEMTIVGDCVCRNEGSGTLDGKIIGLKKEPAGPGVWQPTIYFGDYTDQWPTPNGW